ncbi:D-hexose-6-phosphate mutarotase [Sulfurimonas sp.]
MISFKEFDNGFPYIEVLNDAACAEIAFQGAHIFHFSLCEGEPLLWLSEESDFEFSKAIRGGVPICWPAFGMNNQSLEQHGFARVEMWELVSADEIDERTTQVILKLTHTIKSLKKWHYKFALTLKITISDTLTMELTTLNLDEHPFILTQAFHTYFQVSNISDVSIKGLDSKPYLDALTSKNHTQIKDITFNQEIDRVYQEVDKEIILKDKYRSVKIKNEGSSSAVVWNPWIEKSKRMSAMSEQAYKSFVCIESANAFEDFKVIQPNESHTLKATIY